MRFLRHSSGAAAPAALAALLVLVGPFTPARAAEDIPALSPRVSDQRVATIPVEGMARLSCAASIKRAVRNVDGVTGAEIDFVGRTLRVTYAAGRPLLLSRVRTAISGVGYTPGDPVMAP
ncbi:heavy metal-associated domain-containing protein [Methylobacterium sp. 092160098-2]|uniref:heavy-metal-associated domain-containing protein n=1 Tax=Methylobacterium sp. 092160098-2 TaxID=3025129 RepID=UPI002381AFD2|nr:heavy metal-associated domain-containing protein [Methylobacterium sp. 092160098-2]MDE4915951.1 heavy metal-associated domain-containing protein [Methylobacterium sp. 092160098-2]